MIKRNFLPLLLWLLATPLFTQNTDELIFTGCGTDLMRRNHPELHDLEIRYDAAASKAAGNNSDAQVLRTLPVVVHIIHNNGPENIPDAQVQQGIAQLNAAFNATFGTGVNTDIQFCLAQRNPLGQTTTGITRDQSTLTSFNLESQDLALKNINRWAPTCYINIWVVSAINSTSSGNGVVGYAYLPSAHGKNFDGIVVEAAFFGSSQARTSVLVHEMGHYLGLYHTFEGGCGNNNCLLDGDRVCDTPPDKTTFSSCNPNANSCDTDTDDVSANNPFTSDVPDLGEDYMDYSSLSCYSKFTQGQSIRMNWHITNVRSSLLGCLSCQTPCLTPVTATITAPATPQIITVGSTVNFSATATNSSQYAWNVGNGPVVATTLNTSHTFNSTGVFWVKFRAVSDDPDHCLDALDSVQITVICDATAVFSVPPLITNGITTTFANNSTNATGYEWLLDNVLVSTATDLNYTFPATGVYQLCLRATGNGGCTNSLCTTVYVVSNGGPSPGCDNTFIQSLTDMGGTRPNIFPHPNGDFFATGLRNDSTVIVRFDQGGVPLWARAFRLDNYVVQIRDMMVDASGDLIGVAHPEFASTADFESFAFRYNPVSHSFVWVQHYPDMLYTQVHPAGTDRFVFTGESGNGNTHLTEIDKNTGAIASYNLEGEDGDYFSTLYNGTLYGTCRRYYNANGDFRASVFAHDLNSGAFLWQNSIISEGNTSSPNQTRMYPLKPVVDNNSILVLAFGDLVGFNVFGVGPVEMVLAKTSLTGDMLWTKQYIVSGFNRLSATAIVNTATGYYIVANIYQPALGDFAYSVLIKTDKQGQVQWAKRLGISGKNLTRNVMERNGYLYLTMASDSYVPNDLLLVKLDQDGNTNTDCDFVQPITVDVVELSNIQNQRNYTVVSNGPSPVQMGASSGKTPVAPTLYCNTPCICPDLPISAGSDTTVCAGQPVILQGSPGFDKYQWSPSATLNDPAIQNPTANPAVTTTYTLVATSNGTELIVNGEFSQGNTGFTSEYVYGGAMAAYGHYWVTDDPYQYNAKWDIPLDHSPSADNLMLLFDGDINGTLPVLWEQSVLVQPNTDYVFQFWGAMAYLEQPPVIEIRINGIVQGTFTLLGGQAQVGVWQPYSLNLNSGPATSLQISLRDLNTASLGNDFALDDISLRQVCTYTDSVTVSIGGDTTLILDLGPDISACENAVHTFDAGPGFETYLWQDGSTNQTFTAFGPGTYWVTVRDSCGGVQTDTAQVILTPAPSLDLGPDQTICAGDSLQLIYTSNGLFTTFSWSPPIGISCLLCPAPKVSPAVSTVYYLAATTADGCTSFDSVTIIVNQHTAFTHNITRCENEPFVYNGNVYTTSGTYTDMFTAANGCDSVVTTHLTFVPLPVRTDTIAFCSGDSILIGGNYYTEPGIVVDTIAGTAACDTVVNYVLQYLTPAPSTVTIDCPEAVNIAVLPGSGPTIAHYDLPVVDSDCPCPGIELTMTAGLPSGSAFPPGFTDVCFTARDSCGNTDSCCFQVIIREGEPCDKKEIGCMKYELLTITADAGQNYTYRIRVTNTCANEMIYTAIQLPNGITGMAPANQSVFQAESGRDYEVRNPNYSPFYSIRFKSVNTGIANGQSDIFEYTLPAQSKPAYIHISSKLYVQEYYEAHLNTFNCPVGVTPNGDKVSERNLNQSEPRLFPNPNSGELYVDLAAWASENVLLQILDAQGRQIRSLAVVADQSPYFLGLPKGTADGLYTVLLTTESGKRRALRFLLQH